MNKITTTIKREWLREIAAGRKRIEYREIKPYWTRRLQPWATASKLWQKARSADRAMPVLFGDAADCSQLLYWGVLTDVYIHDGGTRFAVDRLRKLGGKHAPQELVLRSSGKKIAPGFIRPYAICETPPFVNSKHAV